MIDLKPLRKKAGFTQIELAKMMGLSQRRTIAHWEANPGMLTLDRLQELCDIFRINLDDLFNIDREAQDKINKIKEVIG